MRISDWSSDVCSSDLAARRDRAAGRRDRRRSARSTTTGTRGVLLQERGDVEVVVALDVEVIVSVVVAEDARGRGAGAAALALLVVPAVEAGGADRDPHLIAPVVVDHRAEDAVGVGVGTHVADLGALVGTVGSRVPAPGP